VDRKVLAVAAMLVVVVVVTVHRVRNDPGAPAGAEAEDATGGTRITGKTSPAMQRQLVGTPPPTEAVQPPTASGFNSELLAAIGDGDSLAVRQHLAEGASPDAIGEDGRSALARAIELQHGEIIDLLLDAGASLDTRPDEEPLVSAALRIGDDTLALELLNRGAPVVASDGESPLVAAIAQGGNDELLGALLVAGADVNAADGNGETPLTVAVMSGNADLVVKLLSHGAAVNVVGADGLSPLRLALDAGETRIVDTLRRAGAQE
jgi:ankyrin repeat protein